MNNKKASLYIIIISLFFAALMIVSAIYLPDTQFAEHDQTINMLLISFWIIPFFHYSKIISKNRAKCKN